MSEGVDKTSKWSEVTKNNTFMWWSCI